jgi:NADH:ubiquinone oxidoreductase subunit 6 (subunit J)
MAPLALFGRFALPFEIASLLLPAAIVGSVVLTSHHKGIPPNCRTAD